MNPKELRDKYSQEKKRSAELARQLSRLCRKIIHEWEHPADGGESIEIKPDDEFSQGLISGLHRHVPTARSILERFGADGQFEPIKHNSAPSHFTVIKDPRGANFECKKCKDVDEVSLSMWANGIIIECARCGFRQFFRAESPEPIYENEDD